MTEKPLHDSPLGLMPRWRWDEIRVSEITKAIERFMEIGRSVPVEWLSEIQELNSRKVITSSGRQLLP